MNDGCLRFIAIKLIEIGSLDGRLIVSEQAGTQIG